MPGLSMSAPVNSFTGKKLTRLYPGQFRNSNVNIAPNLVIPMGTTLALAGASANDVQMLSISGTPTGGTFVINLTINGVAISTGAIAYNATASAVQTALAAVLGTGNTACTGGVLPGTPVVITFQGLLANQPVPVSTSTSSLTGGTNPAISIAHTTVGATANQVSPYVATLAAAPGAPTVSGTGSGSAFAAGTYLVQVTGVNANGETTPSIEVPVTLTAAQKIRVAALSSLDTSFTSLNVYVNGDLIGSAAVSAGTSTQTDFDAASVTVKGNPPTTNTAFIGSVYSAIGFSEYDVATDAAGNVYFGQQAGSEWGQAYTVAPVAINGDFRAGDLIGLDANALKQMGGRVIAGTISSGVVHIP